MFVVWVQYKHCILAKLWFMKLYLLRCFDVYHQTEQIIIGRTDVSFWMVSAEGSLIVHHSRETRSVLLIILAASWQNQQNDCAPSEDSDQPGHPPSLIRVFAVRMNKAWVLSYPLSAQRLLIRLGGCSGWSESLLFAQTILLVLPRGGSNDK